MSKLSFHFNEKKIVVILQFIFQNIFFLLSHYPNKNENDLSNDIQFLDENEI